MNHFNQLTPAEAERIAILMEECGEVVQACGKVLRHGYESYSPFDESKTTNRLALTAELGDLLHSIKAIEPDIDVVLQEVYYNIREGKISTFTHHQEES